MAKHYIPHMNGEKYDRLIDLDDPKERRRLGLRNDLEYADLIVHYPSCKSGIIEEKGRAQPLSKARRQIESTLRQLRENGTVTNIQYAITIKEKIPRAEDREYELDRKTNKVKQKNSLSQKYVSVGGLQLHMFDPRVNQLTSGE